MTTSKRETGAPPACHFETRIGAVVHVCNRPKGHGPPHYMELFKNDTAREPAHLPAAAAEIVARHDHFAVVYETAAAHIRSAAAPVAGTPDPASERLGEPEASDAFSPDPPSAPVAGSASFSDLLVPLDRSIAFLGLELPEEVASDVRRIFNECRARVEEAHRAEVEELEGALAGSREALEVCVESENAMRKERDEARADYAKAHRGLFKEVERRETAEAREAEAREALRGAVEVIEQTEWLAFTCDDAAKLKRARAVLGARPVPSGDHPNSSNEEGK